MEEKRARRRRDLERMKARARRVYGRYERSPWWQTDLPDPKRHEKLANHMAHCSKMCCGNPRRLWKADERLTLQELRFKAEQIENGDDE